ncbi:haloacid dehalogenase [Dichomitus squalens]|uniref:Haloacid dehalogenase n=1 Tax=Dichomitus squalens TaxID=114155 RepID=A0A4Q9MI68_9APHY|nr:haloacid dehalogenase [Dichomitus squalens]
MSKEVNPLDGVEAYVFDVFGTVVDWLGSVTRALEASAPESLKNEDWSGFTKEWRKGYGEYTRRVANGGQGSNNADVMHREILDGLLESPRWSHLAFVWDDAQRQEMVQMWHKLDGWPDSSSGLYAMKKKAIIGTLSNGNVRLLVDMAKYANLPWDVVFSGELLGSYKPNPKTYLGAIHHLDIPPEKCAMVAAHIYDLRAAASHGMKTVYVRRPTEDGDVRDIVKTKADGGEVDVVVDSFEQLANLMP